mgnify:CR=1 FL=1
MTDKIPHFSTFGKNYVRRFEGTEIFEKIFEHILMEAKCNFVDASAVFIDARSANKKKSVNETVKIEAKHYQKELMAEIQKEREEHGKKPLKNKDKDDDDDNNAPPTKDIKKSTTDPECGLFHKGEHKVEFAYTAHTACDKHNFVRSCDVSAGNVHDSVMFDGLYKNVLAKFPGDGSCSNRQRIQNAMDYEAGFRQ